MNSPLTWSSLYSELNSIKYVNIHCKKFIFCTLNLIRVIVSLSQFDTLSWFSTILFFIFFFLLIVKWWLWKHGDIICCLWSFKSSLFLFVFQAKVQKCSVYSGRSDPNFISLTVYNVYRLSMQVIHLCLLAFHCAWVWFVNRNKPFLSLVKMLFLICSFNITCWSSPP